MQTPNKLVKTRRKFDNEFKIEALRMVAEGQPGFCANVLLNNELIAIQPRNFVPRTTDSRHRLGFSPNLLLTVGSLTGPNQVWIAVVRAVAKDVRVDKMIIY